MEPTPADLAQADRVTKFWFDVLTETLPAFYKELNKKGIKKKHCLHLTDTYMVQLMDTSDGPSDAADEDYL